ncbi:MAG: hypothetical protein ACFB6S_08280 [Geminicoccaceae bacterium]
MIRLADGRGDRRQPSEFSFRQADVLALARRLGVSVHELRAEAFAYWAGVPVGAAMDRIEVMSPVPGSDLEPWLVAYMRLRLSAAGEVMDQKHTCFFSAYLTLIALAAYAVVTAIP